MVKTEKLLTVLLFIEREQQIAAARKEIEKLERELKEQIERDRTFQTHKVGIRGEIFSDLTINLFVYYL